MSERKVEISWWLLCELWSAMFSREKGAELTECTWCGEKADIPSNVKHGITGNEPCGVGVAKDLLWPAEAITPTKQKV